MKSAATPQLYLLSRPTFDVEVFLAFLSRESLTWRRTQSATEAEEIVEAAGRICYMSFGANQSPRDNFEYVQNLIRMGHDSVLEHVSWTVLVTGVSRAFTHQLVRHRVGFAFSQLSQQYHDEHDAGFVMPPILEQVPEARKAWADAVGSAKRAYVAIVDALQNSKSPSLGDLSRKETLRAIRSTARSVLPQATETKIILTANARAMRHFLKTRGSIEGDVEMRQVCTALFNILKGEAPSLFCDFKVHSLPDNSPAVVQAPDHQEVLVS